jgi:hypothetical protein
VADRYWRGTTSTDWSNTNNWSNTSGGSTGFSVPTNANNDFAIFDANGNNPCNVPGFFNLVNLNMTSGYTATLSGSGLNIQGGTLVISANSNITCPIFVSNGSSSNFNGGYIPNFFIGATQFTATYNFIGICRVGNLTRYSANGFFTGQSTLNGGTIEVSGDCTLTLGINSSSASNIVGTTTIVLTGTGSFSAPLNGFTGLVAISLNTIFNTASTITLSGTIRYSNSTFTHTSGTIVAKGSTFIFNSGVTILGASRMNLDNVQIAGGGTITMNEFFSGTPQIPTKVVSTTTTNYTINFTDGFEKLAKNVRVSRCTIGRRGQLLLLSKGGFGVNNLGIRYYNQLPNGVSTDTQKFVNNNLAGMPALRAVNMLVGDPVFT